MSSSADIRFYDNSYLNAAKKGLVDKSSAENYYYDQDRDNSSSNSDDEIQTRSKTAKKTAMRNAKVAAGKQRTTTALAQKQPSSSSSPIVEKNLKKLIFPDIHSNTRKQWRTWTTL